MSEARLREELAESTAEIARLRERMSTEMPTVHKDLSFIYLVPRWSSAENVTSLEEYLSSIDGAARIGQWEDADCLKIAVLRLVDPAQAFYNSCSELDAEDATWQELKSEFRERFKDVHSDQYHFTKLQTARQANNEGPQKFADRCRGFAEKVMSKANDPVAQRIHSENEDRMCLASFVAGLTGVPGRQVRYENPQNMQQFWAIALSVTETEKQWRCSETFLPVLTSRVT